MLRGAAQRNAGNEIERRAQPLAGELEVLRRIPGHRFTPDVPRASRRTRPNSGAVHSSSTTTRVTWNAVTSGTPSCSTLAVMHISAIPPGASPSASV